MALFDPRVGDVQDFLQGLLNELCTNLELPKFVLFLAHSEQHLGFVNKHVRVVSIERDVNLEEQLEILYHEVAHMLIHAGFFGEDLKAIQEWFDARLELDRVLHGSSLHLPERLAEEFQKNYGQKATVHEECKALLVFLHQWEQEPELLFQQIPESVNNSELVSVIQRTQFRSDS